MSRRRLWDVTQAVLAFVLGVVLVSSVFYGLLVAAREQGTYTSHSSGGDDDGR